MAFPPKDRAPADPRATADPRPARRAGEDAEAALERAALAPPFGSSPALVRTWSAAVLLACLTVLGIAWTLKPDARGYGTHEQLGLARCASLTMTGLPCPTCGMTTAFAFTVRGDLISAFRAQPSGLLLALGSILAVGVSAYGLFTGRLPVWTWIWATPYRVLGVCLLIFVAGWAVKLVIGLASGELPVRLG